MVFGNLEFVNTKTWGTIRGLLNTKLNIVNNKYIQFFLILM